MEYKNYYFQNEKIRLRLWEPRDAEYDYVNDLDSHVSAVDFRSWNGTGARGGSVTGTKKNGGFKW